MARGDGGGWWECEVMVGDSKEVMMGVGKWESEVMLSVGGRKDESLRRVDGIMRFRGA